MYLAEIRDTASKFAATISQILDVDVMIIDRSYARVANTFRYVNDPPPVRAESITGRVLASGKTIVVSDKLQYEGCKDCRDQDDCCISQIIAVPIFYEDAVVGAIDLLVPFGKRSPVFENLELSIDFLERMADLLSSKLRNIDDYNKLDVIKKEREILLDFVEEALVYTNETGEIVHWNNQFGKLFNIDSASAGRRLDKVLDHPAIRSAVLGQRSFSNQEFRFSDRNVDFSGFLSCRNIQKNGVKYGVMFNFKSMEKAYSVMNEISQIRTPVAFDCFKTSDPAMRAVIDSAKRLAVSDETILVSGPQGTGKSMLARAMHDFSDRASKPFLVIDCRGFSPEYLEDEVFGRGVDYELTPSSRLRMAQDGTAFFRHVEDLPLHLQKRLTRVMKAKKLEEPDAVSARLLFSSSGCVVSLAERRLFDEELAVRISQNEIRLPALDDRVGDVPLLAEYAAEKYARLYGRGEGSAAAVAGVLARQVWPGNVRQLEKAAEYLLAEAAVEGLTPDDLEERAARYLGAERRTIQSLEEMERELILKALSLHQSKDEAARALRIGRATLYRKLKQYGMA